MVKRIHSRLEIIQVTASLFSSPRINSSNPWYSGSGYFICDTPPVLFQKFLLGGPGCLGVSFFLLPALLFLPVCSSFCYFFISDSPSKGIFQYLVISGFPFIFKQAAGSFMGRICMLGNFTPEQGLAT